ncbi:hypothetical protein PI125_g23939 [Phytophthora idaei]|nr:hypothetical protein PI125_g23939 [Phytophthora idaei]
MVPASTSSRRCAAPPRRILKTVDSFQLSQLVFNAVKVLLMFYSGTTAVEKACDFWEILAAHTEGLPDRSRLFGFRQKLKGREAERWWNNLSIRTFATLKMWFHNQFLSRTADEAWELPDTPRREMGRVRGRMGRQSLGLV